MLTVSDYELLSSKINFINGIPYRNSEIAGHATKKGYRVIGFKVDGRKKSILAHRLNWYMHNKEIPNLLDHINGLKDDNRIQNLRKCNYSQNNRNRSSTGTSKYLGVSRKNNKWRVQCQINKKIYHIGCFDKEEDAAKAYDKFCIENSLKFANLNILTL